MHIVAAKVGRSVVGIVGEVARMAILILDLEHNDLVSICVSRIVQA